MAETLLSPGFLARENDQSQVTQNPQVFGAAIIGPAVKGPVEIPTLVTSYTDYTSIYGGAVESGSTTYSYLTSIAVNNYFQNGGTSMLMTRVVPGGGSNFTPASSSVAKTGSVDTTGAFVLETISEGEIMNSDSTEGSNGTLPSGSKDNVRWEITSANTSSGTFNLTIRRGDDKSNDKSVIESYANLSLDPYSTNYIVKRIGDTSYSLTEDDGDYYIQETGSFPNTSRYVRVKSVNLKTPKYFDNNGVAKDEFTGSLPIVQSGSFGGATGANISGGEKFYDEINANVSGVTGSDYTSVISLLSNQDNYKYNLIFAPGLTTEHHSTQLTEIVNNAVSRGDHLAVIDLRPYGSTVNEVVGSAAGYDSSYASTYWPWLQTIDPNTGNNVWVPASTLMPGVFAFTDASSDPWFAPAGITRGGLGTVIKAERQLTAGNRDTLYEANVNPIATFPGTGVVVYGQKTLQKRATALDRVNVRRLLVSLKEFIGQVANTLVFEQNTVATRNNFLTQVNPYLESVQQRQGLYAFQVVMDESNNTADVVDRNELVGQIFLQPTKTAEYIVLDFNVLPTGAVFPA